MVSSTFEGSLTMSVPPFEDAHGHVGPGPRMAVDEPALGVWHLQLPVAEVLLDAPLQLPKREDALHEARRANGVAARQQPAGRIHRDLAWLIGKLEPVIDALQEGSARFDEFAAVAVLA